MDFRDTDEHRDLRSAVGAIAAGFGAAYYAERARAAEPCTELWSALGDAGFLGVNIPEAYDGGGGGLVELALVCEEIAAQGTPILLLLVSAAISAEVIAEFGSEEQRKLWLPGLARGSSKVVFAITEPEAGSNTHRLATTATRDQGTGDWLLRGSKYYISGVDEAEALLVVARTGRDSGEDGGAGGPQLSLFVVPTDAPGLQKTRLPVDVMLPEKQFTVAFDDVRVGADALVGQEGTGFRQVFSGLNPERITGAAMCVGIARYALGVAARYACDRQVWATPIGAHQGVSHPLAKAKIETELAALMTAKAAWLHDQGLPAGEASNMAKYAAAEAALAAIDAAIQTHGGNGVASEYGLDENLIQRINVGDMLTRTAASHAAQLALVDGDRRWTYAELNAWVNRLAHGLAGRGYARGDALGLASGNSAEFLAVYYACAKLGVVCVPMNLGWRTDEVAYVLGHSQARGIVVESQLVGAMRPGFTKVPDVADVIVGPGTGVGYEAEPADRRWSVLAEWESGDDSEPQVVVEDRDALSYLYTSGTTSFPKGVVGSHKAIYLGSMSGALESGWHADDRFVAMMPMFHTAQRGAFCTPAVLVGATIHVLRAFDPAAFLDTIEREQVTQVFGLPMMFQTALEHPSFAGRDLSSLRRAVYAMAPMPDALIRACLEGYGRGTAAVGACGDGGVGKHCEFALLFGQTEMSPVTTLFRPEHQLSHIGAVGTPITGVQVAIMDRDGELLPTGEQGEIVYRGPSTMNGYLRNPDATAEAFAHGWFHSGDVGRFDDDGVCGSPTATRT